MIVCPFLTIFNAVTGNPVANAQITVSSLRRATSRQLTETVLTDANGVANLGNFLAGRFLSLTVKGDGIYDAMFSRKLVIDDNEIFVPVVTVNISHFFGGFYDLRLRQITFNSRYFPLLHRSCC